MYGSYLDYNPTFMIKLVWVPEYCYVKRMSLSFTFYVLQAKCVCQNLEFSLF